MMPAILIETAFICQLMTAQAGSFDVLARADIGDADVRQIISISNDRVMLIDGQRLEVWSIANKTRPMPLSSMNNARLLPASLAASVTGEIYAHVDSTDNKEIRIGCVSADSRMRRLQSIDINGKTSRAVGLKAACSPGNSLIAYSFLNQTFIAIFSANEAREWRSIEVGCSCLSLRQHWPTLGVDLSGV